MRNLSSDIDVIRDHYDRFSHTYDEKREKWPHYLVRSEFETEFLEREINEVKAGHVLDAGIGTGRLASRLMKKNIKVFGFDISINMLQEAKHKGINQLVLSDICHLPFRNHCVDIVFSMLVLSHVLDLENALKEMKRVAREKIVFEINNKWSLSYLINKICTIDKKYTKRYSSKEMNNILINLDFKSIKFEGIGILQFPRLVFNRRIIPIARLIERLASRSIFRKFCSHLIFVCDV